MNRLFLFAIGGTGARVVRSIMMMLAAGVRGLDSSNQIIPLIIDYDLSNGDKSRAVKAIDAYAKIHNALYPDVNRGARYEDHFFMTQVRSLQANANNPYEFYFGPQTSEKFATYLQKAALNTNPNTRLTEQLLEALYDTSDDTNPNAELELDMAKGFKGNPNIGAVVFHELKHSPEYQQFANTFNPQTDKVFIISSIFGGTGASGFPELVNAIRTDPQHAALTNAQIGAALVLPYFNLKPFIPGEGDTGAIDAASFNSKTKAALGFYATQNGINARVNKIYYIGDENTDDYAYAEGTGRQQNKAHVVEFVAATAVLEFLLNNQQNANSAYEFAIKEDRLNSSIKLPDFYPKVHTLLMEDLSTFALSMKYYRDVLCGDRNQIGSNVAFYATTFNLPARLGRGVWQDINDFLDNIHQNKWGFYSWLNELNDHTHKVHLYCLEKENLLTEFMAHKTVSTRFWQKNPLEDDTISKEINNESQAVQQNASDTIFLKVLRDVARATCQKIQYSI